jgi:DNA-binding beta-propeller fold protein YncE
VTNNLGPSVSQYSIDAGDGHLTALSPGTVGSGMAPEFVAVDPVGRYVYVVDNGTCQVSQYAIGSDGTLAPLSPGTVGAGNCASGDNILGVAVDPAGRFAYVPDEITGASNVLQYGIGSGGVLAPLSPAATSNLTGAAFEGDQGMTMLVSYK